eukprot:26565_1
MAPDCKFRSEIVSAVEANIYIKNQSKQTEKYNIKAVSGYYSDIEICLMYGTTDDGKFRSHWGLICQQQGGWGMTKSINGDYYPSREAKCILFHHMGDGIEIGTGCIGCLRKRVLNAYGKNQVPKPNLVCFDFGRSSAAVRRFLGETSLGRNISYKYNSKYRYGEIYYEWKQTNCCRLVFDLLFYLKLEYQIAVKFTKTYTGHEGWDDVFQTIVEKYPDFTKKIFEFWMAIKQNKELKKVEKLIDGQYKLDQALSKFIDKMCVNLTHEDLVKLLVWLVKISD